MVEQKPSPTELAEYKLGRLQREQKNLENKVEHLYDLNNSINRNINQMFGMWNAVCTMISIIVGLILATVVTMGASAIYYGIAGKWTFFSVVVFVVVYLVVLGASAALCMMMCQGLELGKVKEN